MDLLTGNEMSFYIDQKGPRIGRLSTEIDLEYEASLEEQAHAEREIEKKLDLEMEFINENNDEVVPQQHTPRCKKKLTYKSDKSIQVNIGDPTTPTRTFKKCDTKFKSAIALTSSRAAISIEKARVATQTVCKELYDDNYLLEATNKKRPNTKEDYDKYKYVLP